MAAATARNSVLAATLLRLLPLLLVALGMMSMRFQVRVSSGAPAEADSEHVAGFRSGGLLHCGRPAGATSLLTITLSSFQLTQTISQQHAGAGGCASRAAVPGAGALRLCGWMRMRAALQRTPPTATATQTFQPLPVHQLAAAPLLT
jgi:hypothetical protein